METIIEMFEILFALPENPGTEDYVLLVLSIILTIALIVVIVFILLIVGGVIYVAIDTVGATIKKANGEIVGKHINKGFIMYTRTGPIGMSDTFVIDVLLDNQVVKKEVTKKVFSELENKTQIQASYYLGRLSREINIEEVKAI